MRDDAALLLALDGALAGHSHRRIAEALFGTARVASDWQADGSLRAQVRRLIRTSLHLMTDGYRDIAADRPVRSAGRKPRSGAS